MVNDTCHDAPSVFGGKSDSNKKRQQDSHWSEISRMSFHPRRNLDNPSEFGSSTKQKLILGRCQAWEEQREWVLFSIAGPVVLPGDPKSQESWERSWTEAVAEGVGFPELEWIKDLILRPQQRGMEANLHSL